MPKANMYPGNPSRPNMAYKVEFLPEAEKDFEMLDGSMKRLAAKQIEKIAERPELGESLGKRMGIDLTGTRKITFGKKNYRIVYEIQKRKLLVLIIGIGKRERAEIYKEVANRIENLGRS